MRSILLATVAASLSMSGWSEAAEIKPPRNTTRTTAGKLKNPGASEAAKPVAPIDTAPGAKKTETAIFAGGCFWCMELAFEQVAGVIDVQSGYCGGTKTSANYDQVHLGNTAHAEAIRVTFDPAKVTFDQLLDVFFDSHNPTQLNRQGENDIGRQYRSAIFFADDEQQKLAKAKIAELDSKHIYKRPIVTKLEALKEFYPAEAYHQDFARRNPLLPYIQSHAIPKAVHVRAKHPDLIRN